MESVRRSDTTNGVRALSVALGIIALSASLPAAAADELCGPLRDFIKSVKPGETRTLKFNTIVGSNFKDREGPAKGAKRCDFSSYEPAKAVCKYFMGYISVESSGYSAKSAITCISPDTRFAAGTRLNGIAFSTTFGSNAHSSVVEVTYAEDKDLGGMALTIKANGS